MESSNARLDQRNEGISQQFFGSGLSELTAPDSELTRDTPVSEDVLRESALPASIPEPEPQSTQSEPSKQTEQAFIGPDGQVHQIPSELIGPDGKMLPLNERTMAKLREKYFTVRHILLKDCGHKMDAITFPKRNCENCYFQWFNHHGELVRVADEFYRQYGKERLIAMRGKKFTVAFLRFMSTVQHFLKNRN